MSPTDEQLQKMKVNAATLAQLEDLQLIMLALAELVQETPIPIGKRIPLVSALQQRAGTRSIVSELSDAAPAPEVKK